MTRVSAWRTAVAYLSATLLVSCSPAADPSTGEPSPRPSADGSAVPSTAPSAEPTPPAASADPTDEPLAWGQLEASGPAAREDHTWTVDEAGTTAFLFGGRDGLEVLGDLWAYDLATDRWSAVEVQDGPAPRFGHEAVWVEGTGLVIFAGQAGPTFYNDLWAFDPGSVSWRQLPSAGDVPVPRYGTCAAIGPDGRLWISHGFTSDGTRFADTKAYDFAGGTWTDETPAGDLPINRCLHGCWWTADGELVLFGGQTTGVTALDDRWLLSPGDGWAQLDGAAPTARNLYARGRVAGATLAFGGQALDGSRLDDGWLLVDGDADAVRLEIGGSSPAGRSGSELIADPARDRLLLFGGLGAEGTLDDTWQLSGDLPIGGR